jgi:hypothetical protein
MYYIKKYSNGYAIHNDGNGNSRLLTPNEIEAVKKEFPELNDEKVATIYSDHIKSIKEKP